MNIKQVAAQAKLSTATVSRTINGSSFVNPRTAEKVWRAVHALGYYPNTQARSLAAGRSRTFGLIISDIVNPFFPEIVKGFEDTAIQRGYEVMMANTNYDPHRMTLAVRRMIERKVDGVAVMTSEIDRSLTDELAKRGLSIVFLDVGKPRERTTNIAVDYPGGIRQAVQHLVSLGHRRIGFISGPQTLKSARVRRSAFLHCIREFRMADTENLVVEANHKIDGGEAAMRQLLARRHIPTAVLTSNDLSAVGALRAISQAGLDVPSDVSVVGFDDIEISQYTSPALTTVRLSREELGRTAFDALLELTEGTGSKGQEIVVRTSLVVRKSTAPVRSRRATSKSHSA
ncbi:MAG TPA: LacI family DNA-binding transcriptional regulator [Clostridia bacterium]|nr:LacI family DNA-binding transcriptional regulator [Clostridia bacterium]